MGIELMGKALPEPENKRFRMNADSKCDQRVNFRGKRRQKRRQAPKPGGGLFLVNDAANSAIALYLSA
jgi:hypothetical protein